jgi:hypothetical protein
MENQRTDKIAQGFIATKQSSSSCCALFHFLFFLILLQLAAKNISFFPELLNCIRFFFFISIKTY